MIIQQGWRHHVARPLPGVHNSQPILSKNSHPLQGSQRVDTWRKWIQQFLQTKYNWPVWFLLLNTLFSITWVVAEKGKGDKSLVPRNENLKKKKCFFKSGMGIPNLVTCRTNNKKSLHAWHSEGSNNIAGRLISRVVGKVLGPPNHGTIVPWNHNTNSTVLLRTLWVRRIEWVPKKNCKYQLNSEQYWYEACVEWVWSNYHIALISNATLKRSGEANQNGNTGVIQSNVQRPDPLRVVTQ